MVAIVGANTSGKSTLCYAIAGGVPHFFHGVFHGHVPIGEKTTSVHTVVERARSVGLVLPIPGNQLSGVRQTVFEEIAFGLENMGVQREKVYETGHGGTGVDRPGPFCFADAVDGFSAS